MGFTDQAKSTQEQSYCNPLWTSVPLILCLEIFVSPTLLSMTIHELQIITREAVCQ